MYRDEKMEIMLCKIAANVDRMEQELKEEYKKLIRLSSEFDDITSDFVLLERQELSAGEKEDATTLIIERLRERLNLTFGPERESACVWEAALSVMDESASAAVLPFN